MNDNPITAQAVPRRRDRRDDHRVGRPDRDGRRHRPARRRLPPRPSTGAYPAILPTGRTARACRSRRATRTSGRRCSPKLTPRSLEGSTGKYQNWEAVDPESWVPDGYACVRVDSRGAGRSPGFLDLFSERETRDLYECIEWAAGQPWSNGRVGLSGISYYAMNQWHVAALAAAAPGARSASGRAPPTSTATSPTTAASCPPSSEQLVRAAGRRPARPRREAAGATPHTGQLVCGHETLTDEELASAAPTSARSSAQHPLVDD